MIVYFFEHRALFQKQILLECKVKLSVIIISCVGEKRSLGIRLDFIIFRYRDSETKSQ